MLASVTWNWRRGPEGTPALPHHRERGVEWWLLGSRRWGKFAAKECRQQMWALAHRAVKRIAWDHTARKGGGGSANLPGADGWRGGRSSSLAAGGPRLASCFLPAPAPPGAASQASCL